MFIVKIIYSISIVKIKFSKRLKEINYIEKNSLIV